ncbi:MAG: hypothetical protein CMI26_06790 [Opitutae bacterium]|nr:hypothetical protein [Opitutae bacterium]
MNHRSLSWKNIGSILFIFITFTSSARDFSSVNGQKLSGEVVKYYGDYILFKRSDDHQLFRFKMEILCDKDQAFVKNNFAPDREAVPTLTKPLSPRDVSKFALGVDGLVENQLRKYRQRPNKTIEDEAFLRRAYLKIVGRIPSLEETHSFIKNGRRTTKRQELVDQLLGSDGYASNWYHFWADILRVKERMQGAAGMSGKPYVAFIKDFVRSNKPYDQFVKELLSSKGPVWEKGNGAVGYYFRDRGMPLDNMANTVRIFLGTSLECAQCHDHPFDRWSQKQFYEMAAFTHGVGDARRKVGTENLATFNKLVREEQKEDQKLRNVARGIRDIIQFGVDDPGKGKIRLPKDYQYDNAKPNEELEARTIFGLAVELDENLKEIGSREAYANWLASDANPRFTTVIANRLWKKVMGIGLIEPVDNMMDDTTATNPELLEYLDKLMVALDYDIKEFLRVLYNTKTFNRATPSEQFSLSSETPYLYPGPILERMTAEQIWDSLLVLTFPEIDKRKVKDNPAEYGRFERYSEMSGEELLAEAIMMSAGGKNMMMNKEDGMMAAKAGPAENVNCPIKPGRAVDPGITVVSQGKTIAFCCNGCKNKFLADQVVPKPTKSLKGTADKSMGVMDKGVKYVNAREARASEIGSPAPVGHLVREFGGSDREQIQNSHRDASVTQVLSLLNGYVEKKILKNKKSEILLNLGKSENMEDKINTIFYTIFNRKPDAREERDSKDFVKKFGDDAYPDLIWTLVNSHEFIFVQ